MAIATMSGKLEGLSPIHHKRMLHLNENLLHDPPFSSRGVAEFGYDPPTSFSLMVSMEDLRHFTANGNDPGKKILPDPMEVSTGMSDGLSEIAHIMQGNVASYPSTEHLERGLSGEFGSLGFNEQADFWGDFRLYSQEMAGTMLPLQKLGWNEGCSSCPADGDVLTNSAATEHGRPGGQPSCSYSLSSLPESLAGQETVLECPRALQQDRSSHSAWSVPPSVASIDAKSTVIFHVSSEPSTLENVTLRLSSSCQPEDSQKSLSPSLQPLTSQKSSFHSQPLGWSGAKDILVYFSDTATDSKILDTEHNFPQRAPSLTMSRSHDLHQRREPRECGSDGKVHQLTSEDVKPLKLKQKAQEESPAGLAPRKYRKRQAVSCAEYEMEANSVQTPLDHVQRERQRRDLMTSKIAALELLLPKSSKRDRVSVVYDAIQLLKRLERNVKVLQKRLHEAKLRKARSAPLSRYRHSIPKPVDCNLGTSGSDFSNGVVIKSFGAYMKPIVTRTHPTWGRNGNSGLTQGSPVTTATQCLAEYNYISDKGSVFVEFHVHLDDTATIQKENLLKCQCRMNYLSSLMGVVEQFQLDVTRCNITKLSGYFICIIGLKTLRITDTTTAAQFAARLQSVVSVDVGME